MKVSGLEIFARARAEGWALPAFNVSNLECIQAVTAAAARVGSPVVLQVSPGVIQYAGYRQITQMAIAAAEETSVPVVVHLDHATDPELVKRAIEDGYGSVMYDGSARRIEENIDATAELARYAHVHGAAIEGEIGIIPGSESLQDRPLRSTTADEARAFVDRTEVDVLAPAIGSIHRMADDSVSVDESAVAAIGAECSLPLALHGGSGVRQQQLHRLIDHGISKVNISSRVGRAFALGIRAYWAEAPDGVDLRRFLGAGRDSIQLMAEEYMWLCRSADRAARANAPRRTSIEVE